MKNINKQEVNLSTNIIQEITNTAKKYPQIHKIILYGSRARKDNLPQAVDECNQTHNDLMRDGVIKRFEYTAELAQKTVRMYLIEEGILDAKTPKAIMKEAYAIGLISNDTEWNNLLNSRNLTSHIYDEQIANAVYNDISSKYLPLFLDLAEKLA